MDDSHGCLPAPTAVQLDGQSQAGATDLVHGGSPAAIAKYAEALAARRRLQETTESRVLAPRVGDRLPIRPDNG